MSKTKIRKPLPKLQPAASQKEASLPGNAGEPMAPLNNAMPGAKKKKNGLAGFLAKSKLATSSSS